MIVDITLSNEALGPVFLTAHRQLMTLLIDLLDSQKLPPEGIAAALAIATGEIAGKAPPIIGQMMAENMSKAQRAARNQQIILMAQGPLADRFRGN